MQKILGTKSEFFNRVPKHEAKMIVAETREENTTIREIRLDT